MDRNTYNWLVLLSLLVMAGNAVAQPADEARALAASGEYEAALERLSGDPDELSLNEQLLRAEILATVGRVDDALDLLEPQATTRQPSPEVTLAYAELVVLRGRPSRAIRLLDELIALQPLLARAYAVRGLLHFRLGHLEQARADFQVLATGYEGGLLTRAEEITAVAEAYHRLAQFEEANAAFAAALDLNPTSVSARLGWTALLLEKYRPDQALELTGEVLATNPRQPRALLLRARAMRALEQDPDGVGAQARAALAVNPELAEAFELLAELAIDDEQYQRAVDLLDEVLARDEARLEALSLQAAAYFLMDDRRDFRRLTRRTLDLNPTYAQLYVTVADFATHVFRYDEALDLYERALELDPAHGPANLGLGIGLSRQGDDEAARIYLERALEIDPFNERAYRMVRLYEEVLDDYDEVISPHFRFRFHREERRILEAFAPDLLEGVYARYVERYGVELPHIVAVEVFADAETYATRSVGLPHVGPHGICFGRLITAPSPRTGEFNWAEVLAHELSHAFTLVVSDARIPRWLSEGLAEFDTAGLRSEWQREAEFALLERLRQHSVPSLAELNRAFVRVRDVNDVRAAYAQSALVVQFISSGWGTQAPLEMLRLFRERRRLGEVLRTVTGLEVADFDAAFELFLRERLGGLLASFEPNFQELRGEAALAARAAATPGADVWAELAVARLQLRQLEGCERAVQQALALEPRHPLASFVAGFLAIRERRLADARSLFERILEDGYDGYSLRLELAYLSRRQGRSSEALTHYERAAVIYANGVEPYVEMADIHLRAGDQAAARANLERVVVLDQRNYEAATQLFELAEAAGENAMAARACELADHINPFDVERQGACGRLAYRMGEWSNARRRLEVEMALGPADVADTRRLLAAIPSRVEPEDLNGPGAQ